MLDLQKILLCAWEIVDSRKRQRKDGWGALIGEMDQLSQMWMFIEVLKNHEIYRQMESKERRKTPDV
jgi:hypothetical protein